MEGGRWPRATAGPPGFRPATGDRPRASRRRWPPPPSLFPSPPLFLSFPIHRLPPWATARLAREGRSDPTGCLPGIGGGRRSQPGPGEPTGTPPGPKQAADRLGSVTKVGPPCGPPLLYSGRLEQPDTPPLSPLWPPRAAEHNNERIHCSSRSPSLPLYFTPDEAMEGGAGLTSDWLIAMDGGRRLLSPSPFIVEEKGGVEKEGAARRSLSCRVFLLLPLFHPIFTWGITPMELCWRLEDLGSLTPRFLWLSFMQRGPAFPMPPGFFMLRALLLRATH